MFRYLYIIAFLISASAVSQTKLDSLLLDLKATKNDSVIATLYLQVGNIYVKSNSDYALYYFDKSLLIATTINNKKIEAESLLNIAYYYENIHDYKNALNYYFKSLDVFKILNDDTKVAKIYSNIGYSYKSLCDLDLAYDYYLKSLSKFEILNNKEGMALNYNDIGTLFYEQESYDKALEYYIKSLELKKELNDKIGVSNSYVNIGSVIADKGNLDEGIEYLNKSLAIYYELKDSLGIATCYNNIGDCYIAKKEYNKALRYFEDGLTIAEKFKNKDLQSLLLLNLADTKNNQNQFTKAIPFALKSNALAKEINSLPYQYDNYSILSRAYEGLGNSKTALKYFKLFKEINDSISSNNKTKSFEQLNALYELENKKQEIEILSKYNELKNTQLKNQKYLTYILIVFALIASYLTYLLYNQNKAKQKTNKLLSQQKEELEKLHNKLVVNNKALKKLNNSKNKFFSIISHDLKSPFNSIIGFSEILIDGFDKNSKEENKRYLGVIKDSSKKAYDLLQDLLLWARSQTGNIEFKPSKIDLNNYILNTITLLKIQASNKNIEIKSDLKEHCEVFADVNMIETILRNLLSNAIKFTNINGKINISIQNDDKNCIVSIKDSGIGISKEDIDGLFNLEIKNTRLGTDNETGTGLGLIICKDFIDKHKGEIWVESELGKGSNFKFSLPRI